MKICNIICSDLCLTCPACVTGYYILLTPQSSIIIHHSLLLSQGNMERIKAWAVSLQDVIMTMGRQMEVIGSNKASARKR